MELVGGEIFSRIKSNCENGVLLHIYIYRTKRKESRGKFFTFFFLFFKLRGAIVR